jgi:hypothetical protein
VISKRTDLKNYIAEKLEKSLTARMMNGEAF